MSTQLDVAVSLEEAVLSVVVLEGQESVVVS
jgi:hypothetical protein